MMRAEEGDYTDPRNAKAMLYELRRMADAAERGAVECAQREHTQWMVPHWEKFARRLRAADAALERALREGIERSMRKRRLGRYGAPWSER